MDSDDQMPTANLVRMLVMDIAEAVVPGTRCSFSHALNGVNGDIGDASVLVRSESGLNRCTWWTSNGGSQSESVTES